MQIHAISTADPSTYILQAGTFCCINIINDNFLILATKHACVILSMSMQGGFSLALMGACLTRDYREGGGGVCRLWSQQVLQLLQTF